MLPSMIIRLGRWQMEGVGRPFDSGKNDSSPAIFKSMFICVAWGPGLYMVSGRPSVLGACHSQLVQLPL